MKKTTGVKTKKPLVTREAAPKAVAEKYVEAVGRRKTAIARVRVFKDSKDHLFIVNNRPLANYFPLLKYQAVIRAPFNSLTLKDMKTSVKVHGGGLSAQAEAIRLGLARALILLNPEWRSRLKALSFLRRDPRMVERKKFGSRKARRPQQWRKR